MKPEWVDGSLLPVTRSGARSTPEEPPAEPAPFATAHGRRDGGREANEPERDHVAEGPVRGRLESDTCEPMRGDSVPSGDPVEKTYNTGNEMDIPPGTNLSEGVDTPEVDSTLVGEDHQVLLGVTKEEWETIRVEGLIGVPTPKGTYRVFFPHTPDWETTQVVIQIDTKKCLHAGIGIHYAHKGGCLADSTSGPVVISPDYFLKVLDAHTALPLFPEGARPASSDAEDLTSSPTHLPPGFISSTPSLKD